MPGLSSTSSCLACSWQQHAHRLAVVYICNAHSSLLPGNWSASPLFSDARLLSIVGILKAVLIHGLSDSVSIFLCCAPLDQVWLMCPGKRKQSHGQKLACELMGPWSA